MNWLPLDPMFHNSEFIEHEKVREYDNDLEWIDFQNFHSTAKTHTGIYAAYHAYPYYPDFIYMDEKYAQNGDDNYLPYLQELKEYCPDMPLIIAEYGVPSSRGNSHFSPYGFHQGDIMNSSRRPSIGFSPKTSTMPDAAELLYLSGWMSGLNLTGW